MPVCGEPVDRVAIKKYVTQLFSLLAFPVYLFFLLAKWSSNEDSALAGVSQFLSMLPGKTGSYFRLGFYRMVLVKCEDEVLISFGTLFSQIDTEIEKGTYIGPQCNIGKCLIHQNCLLGSAVHVMSGKNQHGITDLDVPLKDQPGFFNKVVIGENTWIGNGALIMANVGKKCVVGAGAVVVEDIPDYSIVAGNPAKVIKSRI